LPRVSASCSGWRAIHWDWDAPGVSADRGATQREPRWADDPTRGWLKIGVSWTFGSNRLATRSGLQSGRTEVATHRHGADPRPYGWTGRYSSRPLRLPAAESATELSVKRTLCRVAVRDNHDWRCCQNVVNRRFQRPFLWCHLAHHNPTRGRQWPAPVHSSLCPHPNGSVERVGLWRKIGRV
jgi:hypothetical protein